MLPSMRFFLRFIDLEDTFDRHGFEKKVLGDIYSHHVKIVFTQLTIHDSSVQRSRLLRRRKPVSLHRDATTIFRFVDGTTDTNFAASLGPGGFSWNVVRSEADEMIFRHAAANGAKAFDCTKVDSINFEPYTTEEYKLEEHLANPGRPVSATWSRKDGATGIISFDYLIDASGRAGIMSTKYLKNRKMNPGLKNIANWCYWKGAKRFNVGQHNEGSPFFEALQGKSFNKKSSEGPAC